MSSLLAAGKLVQIRVWVKNLSEPQASVNSAWYIVSTVGSSAATDQDVADQEDPLIAAAMKPIIANNAQYRGVQVGIHNPTPPYRLEHPQAFSTANVGVGTAGATPLPTQVCGILRFLTDLGGAAGRGRWYLPFPAAASSDAGGSPTGTYITNVLTLGADVGVGLSISVGGRTAVLVRVLVHSKNKALVFPPPSPVTDLVAGTIWATQKRRGNYGRPNSSPI